MKSMYWLPGGTNMNQNRKYLAYLALINDNFDFRDPFYEKAGNLVNKNSMFEYEIENYIQKRISSRNFHKYLEDYVDRLQFMEKMHNISLITIFDEKYPEQLKSLKNPPLILYKKGKLTHFNNCVAIVGSRRLSHHGHKTTRDIAHDLAKKDYIIVSGLARGSDTEAHLGALDANGKTVAVLASNILEIYPPENDILSRDIINSGALISEKSGVKGLSKSHFVYRNRIISGLSKFIIISESDGTGGTIRQFEIAKQQGKQIFVIIPKASNDYARKGFKIFTSRGAVPIENANDVLDYIKEKKYPKKARNKEDITYWGKSK